MIKRNKKRFDIYPGCSFNISSQKSQVSVQFFFATIDVTQILQNLDFWQ